MSGAASEDLDPATEDIKFLIDNHDAWRALAASIATARRSVRVLLFYLDVGASFLTFNPDPPVVGAGPVSGTRLEDLLAQAGARGVSVQIVYNDAVGPNLPRLLSTDTAESVADFFRDRENVEVRAFRTSLFIPVHAKLFVIDEDVAFSIGSPFVSDYYDAATHTVDDPRHGDWSRYPWRHQQIRVPVHDVSARLRGPVVDRLLTTFVMHWEMLGPKAADLPEKPPVAHREPGIRATRTLCGNGRYRDFPRGETGILDSYLAAIASAERLIYIENQYVLCPEIGEALVAAVKRVEELELIVLMNTQVDLPLYGGWQIEFLDALLSDLKSEEARRVGLFTLWTHEHARASETRTRVLRTYVHSKVAVVDDTWGTLGSANLDSVSMTQSDYALRVPLLRWLMRHLGSGVGPDPSQARAMELNVEFHGASAKRLRRMLWDEHLGEAASSTQTPLSAWLRAAAETIACMSGLASTPCTSRVLPIPVEDCHVPRDVMNSDRFLELAGVDTDKVEVLTTFKPFSFARGVYD